MLRIEEEERECGRFFLKRVHPMTIGMEGKMARAVTRGQGNERRALRRSQLSGRRVEPIDVNSVLPEIGCKNELVCGVGSNHVPVGSVVAADGKAATRGAGGVL